MKRNTAILVCALALAVASGGTARAASVYIPEGSAGGVVIVDASNDSIVGRIGDMPDVHGLGGAAGARYLVAGSFQETTPGDASAINKPSGVSEEEHAAHHAPTNRPAPGAVSILTVIDTADGSTVARLEVPGAVHHVAVSRDGRYAIATHPNAGTVSVIDLAALAVRDPIHTGPGANYAVFSADGRTVYVSNAGNRTVSEIDVRSWIVQQNLPAGDTPEHIVLSPDGRMLYVTNVELGTVSELALQQGKIVRFFALGGELHGLDIAEDGETLFVSGKGENKLIAIDLRSGELRSAPLGPAPYHLAVIAGTGKLYVSSRADPKVWVIDQKTLTPRGTIPIRGEGHQMVVLP